MTRHAGDPTSKCKPRYTRAEYVPAGRVRNFREGRLGRGAAEQVEPELAFLTVFGHLIIFGHLARCGYLTRFGYLAKLAYLQSLRRILPRTQSWVNDSGLHLPIAAERGLG